MVAESPRPMQVSATRIYLGNVLRAPWQHIHVQRHGFSVSRHFQQKGRTPSPGTFELQRSLVIPMAISGGGKANVNGNGNGNGSSSGFVRGADLAFSDFSALQLQRRALLQWDNGRPRNVFLVKKPNSSQASLKLGEIAAWLEAQGLRVYVERPVNRTEFPTLPVCDPTRQELDLCITLGGDGTVLHLASLFKEDEPLPPCLAFAMGTLGFLTPFDVDDYESTLTRVLHTEDESVYCTLRARKRCEVFWGGQLQRVHHVLNECLIDRGASPTMVRLECYIDGHHITSVQADGLIIATPSGSTAYSLSAGGPMVSPSVPCTLLTPIAPHSLSFRPLVIPETSDIEVHLPPEARSHARASFDGRHTMRMLKDSSIRVTTSRCALPMINLGRLDGDWYEGIVQKLKWNVPIRQLTPPAHSCLPSDDTCRPSLPSCLVTDADADIAVNPQLPSNRAGVKSSGAGSSQTPESGRDTAEGYASTDAGSEPMSEYGEEELEGLQSEEREGQNRPVSKL